MVHHPSGLATTEMLKEILQDTQGDFPYIALESELNLYTDRCSSWHWHDYFEFAVVSSGSMELKTQQQSVLIGQGEGYFVNSNVLHLCRVADGSTHALIRVHQFDRSLLSSSSAVIQRYFQPLEACGALSALKLTKEHPSHRHLLSLMDQAFCAAEKEETGFELVISACFMQAWQALYGLALPLLAKSPAPSSGESVRIKQMIAFIHSHASQPIAAPDIARAANVCPREAFRCFRKVLGTTPNAYLMQYRINTAARMLLETSLPVTDIASDCGFSSPSYFSKIFLKIIGRTPREFRAHGLSATSQIPSP